MYFDADQAGDVRDHVFTSGYVLFFGLNPISWLFNKQSTITRSSTEAEYHSIASALAETIGVKNLLLKLGLPIKKLLIIYCDNVGITYLYKNPMIYSHKKHVTINFHYVRYQVQHKLVQVLHIHAADQLVDTLTNGFPKPAYTSHLFKLGLVTPCLT